MNARTTPTVSGFYRFARTVLTGVLTPLIRFRITGTENLPTDTGFILVCNHLSEIDGVVACWQMSRMGVPARIMAKAELFKVPVVGSIFRGLRLVPVDRKAPNPAATLAPTREALLAGDCVAIYPEGTLSTDPDYWPMKLKTGAARLALDTRVPVLPYIMWGSHTVLKYGAKFPNLRPRQDVRAVLGQVIDLSDLYSEAGSQDRAAVEEATRRIHAAMTAALEELRGEEGPTGVWDPKAGKRVDGGAV